MSLSVDEFANLFYRLLPEGDLWPTQDLTSTAWHNYIRALVYESQRVAAKVDEWLADWWADQATNQLEDWERVLSLPQALALQGLQVSDLTTTQRRALVVASLQRGARTVAELEQVGTDLGHASVEIVQPLRVHRVAGFLADGISGDKQWPHSFIYQYMAALLGGDHNHQGGWTITGGSATLNVSRDPEGNLTGDRLPATATDTQHGITLSATSLVQISIWAKSDSGIQTNAIRLYGTSGLGTEYSEYFSISEQWKRFSFRTTMDTTSSVIGVELTLTDPIHFWQGRAGVVDSLLETYIARAKPVHTYAEYRVYGDFQNYVFNYP